MKIRELSRGEKQDGLRLRNEGEVYCTKALSIATTAIWNVLGENKKEKPLVCQTTRH